MQRTLCFVVLLAGLALGAQPAHAELVVGQQVVVPFDNAIAEIQFVSSEASYTGELYFLGSGMPSEVLDRSADTREPGLGQYLFSNHDDFFNPPVLMLDGVFQAGDVLHFAYDLVAPETQLHEIFRTDVPGDMSAWAYDQQGGMIAVEDIRPPHSDLDYNDLVFHISFAPAGDVPAPGALALLGLAGLASRRRRRKL